MTRNLIDAERAQRNRTEGEGRYTYNAPIASDITGIGFTIAVLRLGDHAHLDISSGQIRHDPWAGTLVSRGGAGHLILRWHEWEVLRDILATSERVHIAEVERPTAGQLAVHVP